MRLLRPPRSLAEYGSRQLFSGLRTGSAGASGLGTALLVLSWLLDHRRPARELVYAGTLRPGEGLSIRLVRGDTLVDETEVVG